VSSVGRYWIAAHKFAIVENERWRWVVVNPFGLLVGAGKTIFDRRRVKKIDMGLVLWSRDGVWFLGQHCCGYFRSFFHMRC